MLDKKNIQNIYELTPLQEGMLFHALHDTDSLAYFEQTRFSVTGELDVAVFETMWNRLVRRHDILRTAFVHKNLPEPLQVVLKERPVDFKSTDLRALPDTDKTDAINTYIETDRKTPFDLARDPLLRIALFQTAENQYEMIWSFHHILMDGWSTGVLQEEAYTLYGAMINGDKAVLSPSRPFVDFIKWLRGQEKEAAHRYYSSYLSGYTRKTTLADRSPQDGFDPRTYTFAFSEETTQALYRVAQRNNATINTLVQTAWGILLAAANQTTDAVFAATVSGRPADIEGIERMVGLFINAVPVRIRLGPGKSFSETLKAVQAEAAAGRAFHQASLAEIQAASPLKRGLLDHILVFENYPEQEEAELSEIRSRCGFVMEQTDHFDHSSYDLTVQVVPGDRLSFHVIYNARAYDASTVEGLFPRLKSIFEAVSADDSRVPLELPVFTEAKQPVHASISTPVALSATFTADTIGPYIEWWCAQFGQPVTVHSAPYNQVFQELLTKDGLVNGNPGPAVLFVRFEDWLRDFPQDDETAAADHLETHFERLTEAFAKSIAGRSSETLVGLFPVSPPPVISEKLAFYVESLNRRWKSFLLKHRSVQLLDFTDLPASYHIDEVFDPQKDKTGHLPFTDAFDAAVGTATARRLTAEFTNRERPFKVIAVDCDNTLWKGVCGEDGPAGVTVTGGYADLQRFLIDRLDSGMLIVLVSKNVETDVFRVFDENPQMILKRDHIVAHRINWGPKSENLADLAAELNLSLNSFIFLDDNPVEVAEVMTRRPEVLSIRLPEDDTRFQNFLYHVWAFDKSAVTEEDKKRSRMYMAERKRQSLKTETGGVGDFLQSLGLKMTMGFVAPHQVERTAQLTQRTNQFNAGTIRRTEADIRRLAGTDGVACWTVTATDRFGEYGQVGVVIGAFRDGFLDVDTLLLSCRILGRGVEDALLCGLKRHCRENDLHRIEIRFVPTEKNAPALQFLQRIPGVSEKPESDDASRFIVSIEDLPDEVSHIDLQYGVTPQPPADVAKPAPNRENRSTNGGPVPEKTPKDADKTSPPDWTFDLVNEKELLNRAFYLPLFHPAGELLTTLPVGAGGVRESKAAFGPPETEAEEAIVKIWSAVLRIDAEVIGIDDDFFELGGHSLAATRIVSRIHREFGVEVSLKAFFAHPTPRRLAWYVTGAETVRQTPLEHVPDRPFYPLSPAQRRLWILDRMEENFIAYNLSFAFSVSGNFSPDAFQTALRKVVDRHEALRTVFTEVDGEPQQRILAKAEPEITVHDLRDRDDPLGEAVAEARKWSVRPFDLSRGPLMRVAILRVGNNEHVVVFAVHHIVCDGWSFDVLKRDITAYYRAAIGETETVDLPEMTRRYRDYAVWINRRLSGAASAELKRFWHETLSGEIPAPSLPADYPRRANRRYRGGTVVHRFDADLVSSLQALGEANRASLFTTLTALLKALLYRYSGETDIILGTPAAGRIHPDLEEPIGFFVNTLALRDQIDGEAGFSALIRRVRETTIAAFDHQLYPFDRLVGELALDRDVSRSPVFDVMIVLQNANRPASRASGEEGPFSPVEFDFDAGISQYDLTFIFESAPDSRGLTLSLNYDADLFSPDTARRICGHLAVLGERLSADPEASLATVDILTPAERRRVLVEFNQTRKPIPADKSIVELFTAQVETTPHQTALVFGDRTYSYARLNAAADRIARYLTDRRRIDREEPVGVLAERNDTMVIAMLGIMKAGGAYLPIDPAYPEKRVEYILRDAAVRVLLTTADPPPKKEIENIPLVSISRLETEAWTDSGNRRPSGPGPGDLAYVIYTSGSTGLPKGVMIEHGGFVHMALDQIDGFGVVPGDRVLQLTSPAFDASMSETFMALLAGATLVMIPVTDITDTDRFADFVERNRVTVITFPPAYLNALNRRPLPTVKTIITAGEPAVPADVLHYAKTKQVFNAYGPTETSVCATFYRVDPHRTYDVVPIGGPIADSSLYVVDDRMNPVPVGVPGELCFSGPGLARGYLNRPALTDEKFVENPFYGTGAPSADRLYRIGDVGAWLPDGTIRFAGRKDDQVKIRGYRIEPGEIKAALMKHPAVDDALVRPGKKDIEGLIAYTVGEAPLTADTLRAFLGEHLPGYMIPARFVRLARFPLTVHGKVDTAALPSPESETDEAANGGGAPRNPTEAAVAAAWKSVLPVDTVGIFDDFFTLGGDSIKAIQAAAKLKQEGFGVSPALFFQHPTIAAISPFVGPAGPAGAQANAPVVGPLPLTGIQTWFFQAFMVDRHHFNHSELFRSPDPIDAQAMERALIRLQEHHDMLRTTFRETEVERVGKTIVQETAGVDFPVEFSVFDITGKADANETLTHHCNCINASMNLAAGPLMKTALFRTESGDRLFFAIHHLIVDGVSWRILLEDLMSAYAQAKRGEAGDPLFLPPKTAPFKAWAEQIRNYAEGPALLSEIEAWGRLLPETIPPFPPDMPDPLPDTCRSEPGRMKDRGVVSLELDEPVTKTLRTRGNVCFHAKMDEILLTALGAALGGQHEYGATLITLEGHGREALFPGIDIGRTVGWFTTTYPVLLPHPRADEEPLAPGGRTATGGIKKRIDAVRKLLSQIPNRGFGYNILKYITSKRYTAAARHAFSVKPAVSFNYLGQYDPYNSGGDGLRLQPAAENAGDDVSPHALILHELDFNAVVVQNRLQVVLAYDKTKYRKKTASDIMVRFRTALLEIAEAAEVD